MGLFDKKTCAICGGKVGGIFKESFGDDYVCSDCYGDVHIQQEILEKMTLDDFLKYREFRAENEKLKENFKITKEFILGLIFNKLYLDTDHYMFCLDNELKSTIFKAEEVVSFEILEDFSKLYESTPEGLQKYESAIPDRAMMMAPLAHQVCNESAKGESNFRTRITEPFKAFVIKIYLKDNPWWSCVQLKCDGPLFDVSYPDIHRYLKQYAERVEEMEVLARFLMDFVVAGEKARNEAAQGEAPAPAPAAPAEAPTPAPAEAAVDPIAEIKKFKELLDMGILTEEEFAAKKKELLGL